MAMLRDGRFIPIEQTHDEDTGPEEAYFMASGVANVYVIGSGAKTTEATAFLSDQGSNVFQLDDDIAEEDRKMFLTSDSVVLI